MERRTFLVLTAAAVGLAGCTSDPSEPAPTGPPASTAPSDPDARLRAEVAASEVALIAAYRAAIQANPELAEDLAPFVAQHEAHLDRVAPGFAGGGGVAWWVHVRAGGWFPDSPGVRFPADASHRLPLPNSLPLRFRRRDVLRRAPHRSSPGWLTPSPRLRPSARLPATAPRIRGWRATSA